MNIHTKNIDKTIVQNLSNVAHSLCQSGLLGVFYGSISAKLDTNSFIINRKGALLDKMNEDSFIMLHDKEETSNSLKHKTLIPIDYLGYKILGKSNEILDSREYETLYDRAETDIVRYFKTHKTNFVLLKGCGIYSYGRDLETTIKLIAVVENSCKILHYNGMITHNYDDESRFEI